MSEERIKVIMQVAPLAGAWVEIVLASLESGIGTVAPLAGAWVEIDWEEAKEKAMPSLPSRGRGLKSMGTITFSQLAESLPSRGRGLKSAYPCLGDSCSNVAPLAGAWVEIDGRQEVSRYSGSRSPRGGVG